MALRFLQFEASEADDGSAGFDAMASVAAAHWPALQAELAAVLAWCGAQFPSGPGPLDEGADWDLALQAHEERSRAVDLRWDAGRGALAATPLPGETLRHALSLTLSGTPAFAEAFRQRFGDAIGPG